MHFPPHPSSLEVTFLKTTTFINLAFLKYSHTSKTIRSGNETTFFIFMDAENKSGITSGFHHNHKKQINSG